MTEIIFDATPITTGLPQSY